MYTMYISLSPAALNFIPLNTYLSVPRGDDSSSSAVVPDVTFRFGTTTINSIYVSIVMNLNLVAVLAVHMWIRSVGVQMCIRLVHACRCC